MSPETYTWVKVGHIVGFTLWIGGLIAVIVLLRAIVGVDERARPQLIGIARGTAMLMDLGATFAIAMGLTLAFSKAIYPVIAFKTGAWLHVKLTIVVLGILSMHGMARAKLKKLRTGQATTIPSFMLYAVLLSAAAAIALGANPFLLRSIAN